MSAGCSLCESLETKLRGVLDAASFQPGGALSRATLQARDWRGGCGEEEVPRVALLPAGGGRALLLPPLSPRLPASKLGRMLEAALLEAEGG